MHSDLQVIFLTQGWNLSHPFGRQILYTEPLGKPLERCRGAILSPQNMCFCFAMRIHLNWFFFFFLPQGKQNLSSPDQESNLWPCSGNAETHSLSHGKTREVPRLILFQKWKTQSFSAVVQPLSCVQLFVIPRNAACQASLSFTISQSLLKLMSIELAMPSNSLIICCPLLLLHSMPERT